MARIADLNSLEFAEVLLFLRGEYGLTTMEMQDQKGGIAACMIIDDYMTGGPGFTGKLYIISWDGAPEYVTVVGISGNRSRAYGEMILIGNLGHCECHIMNIEDQLKKEG